MNIRRIATEEAFVTDEIFQEWKKAAGSRFAEPGFRILSDTIYGGDTPAAQVIYSKLTDLGAQRIAQMDADGIDFSILSIAAPGVQVSDAVTATQLAMNANDVLAEAVSRNPSRLAGLATVAPQFPKGAAKELERAAGSLGMKGFLINSHTKNEYLDDHKFLEIFEAAQALDMPFYLHPREPSPSLVGPMMDYGLYFAGWGFGVETGTHVMRLIMSGLFDRFPQLRVAIGHLGEGIPYFLDRIDNRYLLQVKIGATPKLNRLPSEYFRDNFIVTTSGMTSVPSLKLCIEVLGADRIMFAADYPFESAHEAVEFLDTADISEDDRKKIYTTNAESFFKLS
ncbi:amidohydrolase family protein [Holophaga foetida]|uniref:amidohydrolase family protein n=1 Tax=Holophaga foetida TaxID=35839 RepID=UPI0002474CBE|nr:amidohydrolase family protein [Holophaga foetida]